MPQIPGVELAERMGIRVIELSAERAVATMPVDGNRQVSGVVHGGAYCVLAETLGSLAAGVHGGPGMMALGIDINATHTQAASSGTVTGVCTALFLGRTMTVHEIVMTDDEGRRLSTARITNTLRRRRPTEQPPGESPT